jgi:hypothetical protein
LAKAQFRATEFGWVGSANDEVSVCAAWGKSGITRFDGDQGKPIAKALCYGDVAS